MSPVTNKLEEHVHGTSAVGAITSAFTSAGVDAIVSRGCDGGAVGAVACRLRLRFGGQQASRYCCWSSLSQAQPKAVVVLLCHEIVTGDAHRMQSWA